MHIALCLGCRVLGLTLHTSWLHVTRCVPSTGRRGGLSPPLVCVQGLAEPDSRWLGVEGKLNGTLSWRVVLLLSMLVIFPVWSALGFTLGRGIVTVVSVRPGSDGALPLSGVVPVGSGDGVGVWHDAADLSKGASFYFPLVSFFGNKAMLFSLGAWYCFNGYCWICKKLSGSPPHGYHDAYSVGTPKWAFLGERLAECNVRPRFDPFLDGFILVSKRTIYFFGRLVVIV